MLTFLDLQISQVNHLQTITPHLHCTEYQLKDTRGVSTVQLTIECYHSNHTTGAWLQPVMQKGHIIQTDNSPRNWGDVTANSKAGSGFMQWVPARYCVRSCHRSHKTNITENHVRRLAVRIAQLLRNPLGHLLHETIAVKPEDRAVVMPFAFGTFPFPHYNSRFQSGWPNGKW